MICALLTGTFTACGRPQTDSAAKKKAVSELERYARDAYGNMLKNFWSEEKGYMVDPYKDGHGRDTFSDIMWVMQQILFMSMDKRLAVFLLEESVKTGKDTVKLTHEQIAKYMGSAREVVSRMLKYFSSEGIISTSRSEGVRILDKNRLRELTL